MKIRFIQRGDFDGLLGLLVDNLSVFLLLISLNLYVVGMPAHIVFGRIIPGAAIGLLGGNLYYVWMAMKLRKAQRRDDVTALPSGISIVFVLVYTMGILLPVAKITGDPEMAWRICLAANIIGALICLAGAFIGPWLRKFLPSVSMLGALAGLAVVFIAGAGLKDIYANPIIGLVCLAVIVWGYIAGEKMPFNIPAGVMALVIGAVLAVCMGQTAVSMDHVG
ncbi:MAG: NCS2 family permease, partial [Lachnospiraceae bacterium]|nr:NCS2 family permease [Lachnospiraceae bacterium]